MGVPLGSHVLAGGDSLQGWDGRHLSCPAASALLSGAGDWAGSRGGRRARALQAGGACGGSREASEHRIPQAEGGPVMGAAGS